MIPWYVWALLIILVVIILYLIWKHVIIPSLTVTTDKDSYDRTETVHITGDLKDQSDNPIPGKTVTPAIEPPVGDVYYPAPAVTQADGSYSIDWEIPDDAPGGTYTLTVTALGISASKTFRQIRLKVGVLRV